MHHLEENIGASAVALDENDLRDIDRAASQIQPEGERYARTQMAMVGREAPNAA